MAIRCESWGSYPAAKISWLLDGEPIRNAEVTVHSDKEVSKVVTKRKFERVNLRGKVNVKM